MKVGLEVLERERKFYYSVFVFVVLVLMRATGAISEAVFSDFGQTAFIAFMAGNAAEHLAKRKQEAPQ